MADGNHYYAHYSKLDQPQQEAGRISIRNVEEDSLRGKSPRGFLDRIGDGWFWETVSLVLGFLSFGGICVVFAVFSNHTLPSWPLGITVNALVSFLSTVGKALLLVTITQALAQVKWIHCSQRERPLYDMQLLDRASRGVVGSFECFTKGRGGWIPIVGGIVFVLMILMDPFTQQVITYRTRDVRHADGASISKSLSFLSTSQPDTFQNKIWAAMYAGIMAPNTTFVPSILSCPTGHCQWPTYNQLGVCAETQDVSDLVKINCSLRQPDDDDRFQIYSVPAVNDGSPWCAVRAPEPQAADQDGSFTGIEAFPPVFFNRDDVELISVVAGTSPDVYVAIPMKRNIAPNATSGVASGLFETSYQTITSANTSTYFASLYTVYKSSSSLISPQNFTGFFMATQTLFSLCSQTLNVSVNQGVPEVTTLSTFVPQENSDLMINGTSYFQFNAPNSSDVSTIDSMTLYNLANYAVQALNSSVAAAVLYNDVVRNQGYEPSPDGPPPDGPDSRTWMPEHLEKIRYVGDGLAASLTRNIQSFGNTTVRGDSFESETYIHIRWQWLALHGALLLLTVLLFVCTVIATATTKVGIWKSSVWPGLFLVDKDTKRELGDLAESTPSAMDSRARELRVILK